MLEYLLLCDQTETESDREGNQFKWRWCNLKSVYIRSRSDGGSMNISGLDQFDIGFGSPQDRISSRIRPSNRFCHEIKPSFLGGYHRILLNEYSASVGEGPNVESAESHSGRFPPGQNSNMKWMLCVPQLSLNLNRNRSDWHMLYI